MVGITHKKTLSGTKNGGTLHNSQYHPGLLGDEYDGESGIAAFKLAPRFQGIGETR
jgi:hypothetical protein